MLVKIGCASGHVRIVRKHFSSLFPISITRFAKILNLFLFSYCKYFAQSRAENSFKGAEIVSKLESSLQDLGIYCGL